MTGSSCPDGTRTSAADMLVGPFNLAEQQTRLCQLGDVVLDGSKEVPMEFVKAQVRNFFRVQHLEALRAQVERGSSDDGRVWPTAGS